MTPAGKSARAFVGVLLAFLLLYALTAQRGPAWQDSGQFQCRIRDFDLKGELGLALSHPLLIVLGKAFASIPFGEMTWRMNLLPALCGAIAAANIALLLRRLRPEAPLAAWAAAGFYGLAHTPWWLATICESQALLAALFTAQLNLLLSLVRRPGVLWAAALGLASGLGWSAHGLALLALPAYGLAVLWLCGRKQLNWVAVPAMLIAWAAGGALMLWLLVGEACQIGLWAAIHSALFGVGWQRDVLGGSMKAVAMGCGYVLLNFPNLAIPLAVLGLWKMRRQEGPAWRWSILYLLAIYLLFAIRYTVADQFMFFLPFYALVAVCAGAGAAHVLAGRRKWLIGVAAVSMAFGPVLYGVGPAVWRGLDLPAPGRSDLPFRDPVRYWLTPWKHNEDSAGEFARAAIRQVLRTPCQGQRIILADSTSEFPLKWVVEQEKAPICVEGGIIIPIVEGCPPTDRTFFAVSHHPGYYQTWFDLYAEFRKGPGDVLYRIVWYEPQSQTSPAP